MSALSSQQLSALGGLLDLHASMADLQTRVATGKAINSVFDDPTKFLLAGRLNDRADALLATNRQIDLGIAAITSAQKALGKIKADFTQAVSDLKTLKGLAPTTAAEVAAPTDATIVGDSRLAATELGQVTTSTADLQRAGITASGSAITANKRVFSATGIASPASNTDNGNLGIRPLAGMTSLRIVAATGGAVGSPLNEQASVGSIDVTAADVSDGSNDLSHLTLDDIVKKVGYYTNPTFVGAGGKIGVSISADGYLVFALPRPANTFENSRFQIGPATATTAANSVEADWNTSFGLPPIAGTNGQEAVGRRSSTVLSSAAELSTFPPGLANRILTDGSRAVFDTDTNTTNNGPSWSLQSNLSNGNYGIANTNTLSFAVKGAGGTTTYLDVASTDLAGANNTLSGLATVLNAKAAAANLTDFHAFMDPFSKRLTISANVGTIIGVGNAATAPAAHDNAANGRSNTLFGLPDRGAAASATGAASAFADEAAVSLLGDTLDSFQDGDTFAITVRNTTNPSDTRQIRFQATAAGNVPASFTSTSGTTADPYRFNTMQQLAQAITTAFSPRQLSASAAKVPGTGTGTVASQFQMSLKLGASYVLDIEQVTNAVAGTSPTPAGADTSGIPNFKNSANALERIFGQKSDTAAGGLKSTVSAESLLSTIDLRDTSGKVTGHQQDYGKKISFTRIVAAPAQNGDPKRAAVSANLSKILDQIAGVVTDSQVSGLPNLLNGAALTVQLSEKQDRSTTIQLGQSINTDNLGFAAATGAAAGYALLQGLGTDTDVEAAITGFTDAGSAIDSFAYTLGSQGASFVSWQTFNTALSSTLTTSATRIVATDTTADSVQLQAQSTRYALATSALGLLNQAAQSAVQLLR